MPDEALLRIALQDALNNRLSAMILLIPADDLHLAVIDCRKERIVAVDVEDTLRIDQMAEIPRHAREIPVRTRLVPEPRPPFRGRRSNARIEQLLAFGRKTKRIRHEHLRRASLVPDHVLRGVRPCLGRAHRSLRFADNHRDAVDDHHDVITFAALRRAPGELPLVGNDATVILRMLLVKETHVDMHSVLAERIGVLLKEQLAESLIRRHQLVPRRRHADRPQLDDDLIDLRRRQRRIQAPQRLDKPRLDENLRFVSRHIGNRHIIPAGLLRRLDQHGLNRIRFVERIHV